MTKIEMPFVETMASYACNLSCVGCTNYSDLNLKGHVKWSDCQDWLEHWLERIVIKDFGIIGGEPLANPGINDWIIGSRRLLPDAQIRFTTNALLLHKKFEIVDLLHDIGNCVFKITVHRPNDHHVESLIQNIFNKFDFEPVTEFGINRYRTTNGFRFQISKPTKFVKTFKNNYQNMLPHNNNPNDSFDMCVQKTCPLLYKGKIYKCSSIAMLNDILHKFNKNHLPEWQPYSSYTGISPNDTINKIKDFVNLFGKPESICSMCPSKFDKESIINHHKNIVLKNDKTY